MKLLLGTNNKGKVIEIKEVLADLPLELITPEAMQINADIDEIGTTYRDNALLKARHFFLQSKLPTLADDSGILVDALKDELGVFTRRWGAGPDANDEEWITYFLKRMEKESNRRARFICCLGFIDAEGKESIFEGYCDGVITKSLEAAYLPGLPISACFKPDGFPCVYSGMSIEQKNSTSHRGTALKKLHDFLKTQTK